VTFAAEWPAFGIGVASWELDGAQLRVASRSTD
jgi:hypothetical protein